MQQTPKGNRIHIGIFGRRNVGKSSLLNALVGQQVAIVSKVAGTTTDPVEKAIELKPLGPALFVDTAGIDDQGELGGFRVARSRKALAGVDVVILASDEWQVFEQELAEFCRSNARPVVLAANKADLRHDRALEDAAAAAGIAEVARVSALTGSGVDELREAIIRVARNFSFEEPALVGDLLDAGELALLVVPIDIEAPKGRLILPQVQTIRDILDHNAAAMVVKENQVASALSRLLTPPALVITDSQEFKSVAAVVPKDVPLTSFSIIMARYKGDLLAFARGALAIADLKPGDSVLIAESCSHHPVGDDIGRVKIPRWLQQYTGGALEITHVAGHDFPDDLEHFSLIVQCGSCMHTRRQILERIASAQNRGVPITNYGMAIAFCLGIFERALAPFPQASQFLKEQKFKTRP